MLKQKVVQFATSDTRINTFDFWVLDLLNVGENNAITAGQAAAVLSTDPRRFTLAVNKLRGLGYPIVTTTRGYFYPASREEVSHFSGMMHSRQQKIMLACRWSDRLLSAWMPGQTMMDFNTIMTPPPEEFAAGSGEVES